MKKHIKYLFIVLLLIPICVFADMGGPVFPSYDAYVSSKNGAYLYKFDDNHEELVKTKIFFKYKTDIHVNFEEKINNDDTYAVISYKGEDDEYEDDYYINLNNISIYKKEYTLDDYEKDDFDKYDDENENAKVVVIKKTDIYYGPSTKYEVKNSNIPVNTRLRVYAEVDGWYYVKNDDYSGWIGSDNRVLYSYGYTYWFLKDAKTYTEANTNNEANVTIPDNTRLTEVYYESYDGDDEENSWYYVVYLDNLYWVNGKDTLIAQSYNEEYKYVTLDKFDFCELPGECSGSTIDNKTFFTESYHISIKKDGKDQSWVYIKTEDGKTGWIQYEWQNIAIGTEDSLYFVDDAYYYEELGEEYAGIIDAGTIIEDGYYYYDRGDVSDGEHYYYINIDGKYYFVPKAETICEEINEDYGTWSLNSAKSIYDLPNGEKSSNVVTADAEIWFKYDYYDEENDKYWYYAASGKNKGWILEEEEEMQELKANIETYEKLKSESDPRNENATIIDKKKEPEKIKFDKKLTKKETVIIAVLCSVILALVIVVIIILINKKKKSKLSLEDEKKMLEEEKQKVKEIEEEIKRLEEEKNEDLTKDDAFSKTIKLDKKELNKELTADDAFSKTVQIDIDELEEEKEEVEDEE